MEKFDSVDLVCLAIFSTPIGTEDDVTDNDSVYLAMNEAGQQGCESL